MKMTFRFTVFGGMVVFSIMVLMVVFMPDMMWAPKQSIIAHPYDAVQERGHKVYYSNGCNYCHTQYVRESDNAMGPVSNGGDFVFDSPLTLGSERTGPDLSYVGRKRSRTWEIEHLKNPRKYSPLSIMPRYSFLSEEDLEAVSHYLFDHGDRVAMERMIEPPAPYEGETDPDPAPALAVPAEGVAAGWPTWEAAGLQEGKELYVSRCMTCHGCSGNGLGSYGGTLVVTPADFKQEPFKNMPAEQWYWHVSEGVQGTVMPPWKESLTPHERWAVIRYVRSIFSRPAMRDPDEGDVPAPYAGMTNPEPQSIASLENGKHIFTRECLVCHGPAGRGEGPYADFLQPRPPDFGDGSYGTVDKPDFKDDDYFWRVSEGLPWSAMPAWKVEYGEKEIWDVVHYVRTVFTQTEKAPKAPAEGEDFVFPEVFKSQKYPQGVNYERGKKAFLVNCSRCHGPAGDGKGWAGQVLDPKPADFREMRDEKMGPESLGEHMAKISYGIQDTAMPAWGEFLPWRERWDLIKYLMDTFMGGMGDMGDMSGSMDMSGNGEMQTGKVALSVFATGKVAADYMTLSEENWLGEGHEISTEHGKEVYGVYCATCHGDDGKGGGPGTAMSMAAAPAPYPAGMGMGYVFWRTMEGVPETVMAPFRWLLPDGDIWDAAAYVTKSLNASEKGE
ncbi:c-type cytochrome [Paucidesulfovibrio longus]|uniref:c-type cytochrome n=1 Tax=Paucidesulfovibrio longus TaxID=889 RepID=UPI0003B430B7|nr:c-type cytochrome [Paucidesulfovibrio longus]